MRKMLQLVVVLCLCVASAYAQDRSTTGSINGTVTDVNGAAVQNAAVTITGPTLPTARTATTNDQGYFNFDNLIPGVYTVKVELTGFKAASVADVAANVGKSSSLSVKLEPGQVSEVVTVTGAAATDLSSTAVGSNLSDTLFQNIPVQRSVTSLFYLAPGVADSGKGGSANPSISGGSALDNLYIADGVNITDSAFGGLGTFTRNFGTLGTGINTSFIKEVQVKTGGFEAQYGQSQGGIVNIITQSGGNEFHGALYGFARPQSFEATRKQPDDTRVNKFGKMLHEENYDAGVDLGGYVPGARDNLFFFGSFNPTVRREIVRGAEGSGLRTILGDKFARRYRTYNYAFKLDYNINPSHTVAFSIFGDPTETNVAPFATLNIDNATALNKLEYGTRSIALRYNGALSKTWTLSASFGQGKNNFNETGFSDFNQITDRTQPARGNFTSIGYGFFEPTQGKTYRTSVDTSKIANFWGTHTFGLGYQFQRGFYSGTRDRSGPKFTVPATNVSGIPVTDPRIGSAAAGAAIGQPVNATWTLFRATGARAGCTLCPLLTLPDGSRVPVVLRHERGEYGNTSFDTSSDYHAFYMQDTWRFNRYVTALLGLRNEQEKIVGNPGSSGERIHYSFTGNWAPRIGVTVDPFGRGKTKAYYNYGRFYEFIPLDLAERSLSAETDFRRGFYIPDFTVNGAGERIARLNSFGTVIPILDASHLVTGAPGGIDRNANGGLSVSLQDPSNPILPGTKLGFTKENIFGFEQQLPHNFTLSVRYLDRRLGRIVEDAAVVAPESADFFGQTYFIGNVNSTLDAAVNPVSFKFTPGGTPPAQCSPDFVNSDLGICYAANGANGKPAGSSGADGVPDGFPNAVRNYKAVEIELNKRFSDNWQLLSNWRIASLRGNYEGHFRNDNGQTDPAISSLFDFTAGEFNLLGDQFAVGPLNTDRRHIFNLYGNYSFGQSGVSHMLKGLNLGGGLHGESGVPISEYLAHPVYLNAGEIPVGGRGKLGRTNFYTRLDLHADYKWAMTEKTRMVFIADLFNVFNRQTLRLPDQFRESTAGQDNPDFLKPGIAATDLQRGFYLPFSMRLGARFEF
ncbi:MAG: hypothetical protein QOE46_2296 [Acidobacteriota bacterium]|nr:hypothetical protein [Acidobacteriota bacterium]